ncbi:MAG TPA: protein translocase subunit SecD, partial [Methylomirabilota bacterium]|nr:protein translocase subunit SecD [Methylomirabilota bacterium]
MRRNLWLRIVIVLGVIAASVWYLYPPKKTINLGLDLQGGIHLMLGVEVDRAIESQTERALADLQAALDKKGIGARLGRQGATEMAVQLVNPSTWTNALAVLSEFKTFEQKSADQAAGRVVLALQARESAQIADLAVRQGLETIRNRVDQFGVAEPTIQRQGENRILVQLPGIQDAERAKALIGKTALLEFKFLNEQADVERATREGPPPGSDLLWQR